MSAEPVHYLVRIAGPRLESMVLEPARSPMALGRHEQCDLQTTPDEERVSRFHSRFTHEAGRWHITDLKSTWGTYLNGYRLPPEQPHVLSEGDLVRITPWTFSFRSTPIRPGSVIPADDLPGNVTSIRSILPRQESLTSDPVSMLVEAAAGIHQAADEQVLAQLVVDLAQRGTGYSGAAYLRPSDADGRIEVIAAVPAGETGVFSRSMIQAASTGETAVLETAAGATSQSIVQLQIVSAICVPLMLGQAVAAYLYLDNRRSRPGGRTHPRAQDYCLALARIASLALANMKRIEIERRQALLNAQIEQAGTIQKYLLPQGERHLGPVHIVGISRPGQMIGGDFYDVIPLGESRVALTLGDVSGKGVTASVLMTTIHGFLHALLESGMDLESAVGRLNAFLESRKPEEQFATLFAAIIDIEKRQLTYMDAAHGYGLAWNGRAATWLHDGGGPPLGISPASTYTCATCAFGPGDALVIVSDGIIEQPALTQPGREQFEMAGVERALRASAGGQCEVAGILRAVELHAGTTSLADDATILAACWRE